MVNNGQKGNETTFNTAFVSRTDNSDTVGVVGLNNTTDVNSGPAIVNTQRAINKLFDSDGASGEADGNAKIYASTNYVVDGDSRKQAIERLDLATADKLEKPGVSTLDGVAKFNSVLGDAIVSTGVTIDGTDSVGIPGDLTVQGNLTVNGTTTTINTATLDVEDVNVTVNKNGNDALADGAGLTVERTSTHGSLVFDSTVASKWKAGLIGLEVQVADVSTAQTFTNKSIDGDSNTITDLPITSIKTVIGNADKFLSFDATGAPVASIPILDQSVNTTASPAFINVSLSGYEDLLGITTPANPTAGRFKLYFKSDGLLYRLDSSGLEQQVGGGASADQYLSNLLSPTAVNQDLIFNKASAILKTQDETGSASSSLSLLSGQSDTSTGMVSLKSGNGTAVDAVSGDVEVQSGTSSGSGGGSGALAIKSGNITSSSASSGNVQINSGDVASGVSGNITVKSGTSASNDTGNLTIGTGNADTNSGDAFITTGDSNSGTSGDLNITNGAAPSANDQGQVIVDSKRLSMTHGFISGWQQASDPTTPTPANGDVYYSSSANKYRYYNGATWSDFSGLAGGKLLAQYVYGTSGSPHTYTKNNSASYIKVTIVGGGGGSGGAASNASEAAFSGGGGGGGTSIKVIQNTSVGATETVTVGAGGAGGNTSGSSGASGATSSFGSHASATGGTGGAAQASGSSAARGGTPGSGGAGASGDLNIVGGVGTWAGRFSGSSGFPSNGGGSVFGGGGLGNGANLSGSVGSSYGGGGGGSSGINGTDNAGASGADGVVVVEEYA